jgi:hypothetical protein
VTLRSSVIFVLCLAVLAGGSLGTANGMVVCVDRHGHIALEAPHGAVPHRHEACGDAQEHEDDDDAVESDGSAIADFVHSGPGHDSTGDCSDSAIVKVATQKSTSVADASGRQFQPLPAFLGGAPALASSDPARVDDAGDICCRGGVALVSLASIRSVVLLV